MSWKTRNLYSSRYCRKAQVCANRGKDCETCFKFRGKETNFKPKEKNED